MFAVGVWLQYLITHNSVKYLLPTEIIYTFNLPKHYVSKTGLLKIHRKRIMYKNDKNDPNTNKRLTLDSHLCCIEFSSLSCIPNSAQQFPLHGNYVAWERHRMGIASHGNGIAWEWHRM